MDEGEVLKWEVVLLWFVRTKTKAMGETERETERERDLPCIQEFDCVPKSTN
jgi:hypothetical protein